MFYIQFLKLFYCKMSKSLRSLTKNERIPSPGFLYTNIGNYIQEKNYLNFSGETGNSKDNQQF